MSYIENVVIDGPIADISSMFSNSRYDWINNEKQKTLFTSQRFLPAILVEAGIAPSISEVRRNKPELMIHLTTPDFMEIKWGKRKLWILVGE